MSDHPQAPAALTQWQGRRYRLLKGCVMGRYCTVKYLYPSLSYSANTK